MSITFNSCIIGGLLEFVKSKFGIGQPINFDWSFGEFLISVLLTIATRATEILVRIQYWMAVARAAIIIMHKRLGISWSYKKN